MEKEVIAALVAAGAAILVSIVSFISSRSVSKSSNKSLIEIERLKKDLELEYRLLHEEINKNHSVFQESIDNGTEVIQQVKDSILTLLYSHKKINKQEALEISRKAKNDIFEIYRKSNLQQDRVAVVAFHEAKGLAQNIENIIIDIAESNKTQISKKNEEELKNYLDILSDLIFILRDRKNMNLDEMKKKYR